VRKYGDISVENIGGVQMDNYTTRDFVLTSVSEPSDRKQFVRQVRQYPLVSNEAKRTNNIIKTPDSGLCRMNLRTLVFLKILFQLPILLL